MIKLSKILSEIVVKPSKEPDRFDTFDYPYEDENIFLKKKYLKELSALVRPVIWHSGSTTSDNKLRDAINNYVTALEAGWRLYDDTYDGEFDGDNASMDIEEGAIYAHRLYGQDNTKREKSYGETKKELEALVPGLADDIYDLFMEGKQSYYR